MITDSCLGKSLKGIMVRDNLLTPPLSCGLPLFCTSYITVNWTAATFDNDRRTTEARIINITSLVFIYIIHIMYNNIIHPASSPAFIANTNMTVVFFLWLETDFFQTDSIIIIKLTPVCSVYYIGTKLVNRLEPGQNVWRRVLYR